MIVHDVEQGSLEWLDLRAGIPTSSQFHRILTPKRRELSSGADRYLYECLTERKLGHALNWDGVNWMERGRIIEDEAVPHYELLNDVDVERVGFVTLDDGTAGSSPDGIVGTDGMIEIKCRAAHIHTGYLLGGGFPADMTQVQGGLWICEREWCDVYGYCPEQPRIQIRVYRDEDYIADLRRALATFLEGMERAWERYQQLDPGGRVEVMHSGSALSDEELEAVERETRAAVEDGRVEPEVRDEIVQLCVAGEWREVRTRLSALTTEDDL